MPPELHADDEPLAVTVGLTLLGPVSCAVATWSTLFALATVLIVGIRPTSFAVSGWLIASIVAALAQVYFALPCAFDAKIFARLGGDDAKYTELDQVLITFGLKRPGVITRPLEDRIRGGFRLLRWQVRLGFVQIVLLLIAIALLIQGVD